MTPGVAVPNGHAGAVGSARQSRPQFDPALTIGLVVPLTTWTDGDVTAFETLLHSLQTQTHDQWCLTVTAPHTGAPALHELAQSAARHDPRVGLSQEARPGPTPVGGADYAVLIDRPGWLEPAALAQIAHELSLDDADLLYGDELATDPGGGTMRVAKPPWHPFHALCRNPFGGLVVTPWCALGSMPEPARDTAWLYQFALDRCDRPHGAKIARLPHPLFRNARSGDTGGTTADERRVAEAHLARRGVTLALTEVAPGVRRVVPRSTHWPLVSVIIPTRDRLDLLRPAIAGVLDKTDYPAIELIVVDNGSSDPSILSWLESLSAKPHVTVLRDDQPFNFARINNRAALHAEGDVLLFLNNDTEVIDPGWLKEMAGHALRPEIGAVGALLLYPDNRIQHAGIFVGADGGIAAHLGRCESLDWVTDGPGWTERPVSAITAACMAIRRALFAEVGGFDPKLTVSYNDVDLCLRLGTLGYTNLWTPYARLYHLESVSRGDDRESVNEARALEEFDLMEARWGALLDTDPWFGSDVSFRNHQGASQRSCGPLAAALEKARARASRNACR